MKRAFLLPFAVALIAASLLFAGSGAAAADATINAKAGGGEAGFNVNSFIPAALTVTTGTTIHWDVPWFEPHSVTFGTPQGDPTVPSSPGQAVVNYDGTGVANSGLVFGPTGKFEVKFTKAGSYTYICVIHPLMKGTVAVVDSGGTPDTQASADTRGAGEYTAALTGLKGVAAGLGAKQAAVTPKAGGGNKYSLVVAGATDKGDVQQYFPASVNIHGQRHD
jgi:plastocyanin